MNNASACCECCTDCPLTGVLRWTCDVVLKWTDTPNVFMSMINMSIASKCCILFTFPSTYKVMLGILLNPHKLATPRQADTTSGRVTTRGKKKMIVDLLTDISIQGRFHSMDCPTNPILLVI